MSTTESPARAEGKARNASSRKRRIRLGVVLVLLVASLFDWSRPPERQISVPVYEWLVIKGYRATMRPFTSLVTRCRMQPTCSQYSSEAVHKHGLPKGLWLTLKRLGRDMPWVKSGTHDAVR